MHHFTVLVGVILCAIGLFGYFGSASENPSPTALIPCGFGIVLIALGIAAHRASARKHAMHAAAAVALLGFLLGGGRAFMKLGNLVSDDVSVRRPVAMTALMALVCLILVFACIGSFVAARRRRSQAPM
jgi:hypothetical protein